MSRGSATVVPMSISCGSDEKADNTINGNPGGQQDGWSGRESSGNGSGGWVLSRHLLDGRRRYGARSLLRRCGPRAFGAHNLFRNMRRTAFRANDRLALQIVEPRAAIGTGSFGPQIGLSQSRLSALASSTKPACNSQNHRSVSKQNEPRRDAGCTRLPSVLEERWLFRPNVTEKKWRFG